MSLEFLSEYFREFSPKCWIVDGEKSSEARLKENLVLVGFAQRAEGETIIEESILVGPEGVFVAPLRKANLGDLKSGGSLVPFVSTDRCKSTLANERIDELKTILEDFKSRFNGHEDDLTKWVEPFSVSVRWAISRGLIEPPIIPSFNDL